MTNQSSSGLIRLKKNRFFKVAMLGAVVALPVLILMAILGPIADNTSQLEIFTKYRIAGNVEEEEVQGIITHMRQEYEFQFYFVFLNDAMVKQAGHEAYLVLSKSWERTALLNRLTQIQEKVNSLGVLFYYLDYPPDFFANPTAYPQLDQLLWQLLNEEFTLAVLGVCYKTNFDSDFQFAWSETSRQAAQKLKDVMIKVRQAKPVS